MAARLATAADQFADGLITADQLARITAKLRPEVAAAQQEAEDASPDVPLELMGDLVGDLATDRWEALTISQQARVVDVLLESVRILPVKRRGPGFDPDTVELRWKS